MALVVILVVAHLLGLLTSIRALMLVRTSQGAIAWIISLNLVPLIAVPAYWIFDRSKFRGYLVLRQAEDEQVREFANKLREDVRPFLAALDGDQSRVRARSAWLKCPLSEGTASICLPTVTIHSRAS